MLWWGQPTHALHEPQAHTTEDDQEAEQLNQSHKANWGPGGGREREKSFQLKPLDLPIRRIRAEGLCLQGGDCSGAPQLVVPSLSPPPLSKRVPRMFRFITINYFVSGRRQNGHFGLLLPIYNLQDGQCVEDRPSTSGIWRKLEKLGAPICGPSPSQVNK